MNRGSDLLLTIRILMIVFSPLVALGFSASLPYRSMEHAAVAQIRHLQQKWGRDGLTRWDRRHRQQYNVWESSLPHPTPRQRSGDNTIGNAGTGAGDTFGRLYNFMATGVDHAVYALVWVAWPRLLLWRLYIPLAGLLLIAAGLDAYCKRQLRRYSFFIPRLTATEGATWLVTGGVVVCILCLFWPLTVVEILPAMGLVAIALGVMLRFAVPVAGS